MSLLNVTWICVVAPASTAVSPVAGIVFTTDALSSENVERCFEVDAADHDPIVYPVGIVKDGMDAALARDFLDFLRNGAGKDEFTKYGYSLANP